MYEVVWQYDESSATSGERPSDAVEAHHLLLEGNREFARLLSNDHPEGETPRHIVRISRRNVGTGNMPGEAPGQEPFAAFLSCADARVPVELIFGREVNDLFVVRLAGNILGDECLGSLGYAVDKLKTVRLLAVMGHTGCGALTTAVDAYLAPAGYLGAAANYPLQSIISSLMVPVRAAALTLANLYGRRIDGHPGYRQALIETSVILNAALSASVLAHNFHDELSEKLQVAFGVYDLSNRTVGVPDETGEWKQGLTNPPLTAEQISAFVNLAARSRQVREVLDK